MCNYREAWIGKCKKEGNPYCEEHSNLKCVSCGETATHNCDQTMGPFVCGHQLCDKCEHTLHDNGCNSGGNLPSGIGHHCLKTQQVYVSWMLTDLVNDKIRIGIKRRGVGYTRDQLVQLKKLLNDCLEE